MGQGDRHLSQIYFSHFTCIQPEKVLLIRATLGAEDMKVTDWAVGRGEEDILG